MKLIYDFYADSNNKNKEAFNDAIPIGNGKIGAMVYSNPYVDKLVLNNDSLYLGKRNRKREPDNFYETNNLVKKLLMEGKIKEAEEVAQNLYSSPKGECIYSVSGTLLIRYKNINKISNYKRELDLENGILTSSYLINDINNFKTSYFASYNKDLIVVNIESDKQIDFTLNLDREKLVDSIKASDTSITLKYEYSHNMYLYIKLVIDTDGLSSHISDNLIIKGATKTKIYIALDTTFYQKELIKHVDSLFNNLDYNSILEEHKKDFSSLYNRQILKTSDYTINSLYNFSRYLMISGSRNNGQALNLQGLWNQDIFPAWDSKYTININLEMNYFNVFNSNLIECSLPYFNLLERVHKTGKRLTKNMYHSNGFVAFHNTDIYGDCCIQDKYMPASLWPFGGAWLSLKIYEYFEYTDDLNFLRKYFYILKDAAIFFKENLTYIDNTYRMIPALSPENSYILDGEVCHLCKGATLDTMILTDLFNAYLNSLKVLNIKDKYNIKDILESLPKIEIGKYGQIVEWDEDYTENEPGHRHISQLYGLYPSRIINENSKELFKASKKTIERRLENGSGHTGWSAAWLLNMAARLKDKDLFIRLFNKFKDNSLSRTLLDLHPPFQIDGNFGVSSAIFESLINEISDYIELLPINIVENGSITGARLKHNVILSFSFNNQVVTYLKIESKDKRKLRIKCKSAFKLEDTIEIEENSYVEYK